MNPFQSRNILQHSVKPISVLAVMLAASALATQAQVVFSPPKNISNSSSNTQFQQIAVDAKGNINVIWATSTAVLFTRSSDGGLTFSSPVNVSNHSGSAVFFPQLAVAPDGEVVVTWIDNSLGNFFSVFLSYSADGSTFSAPQAISNAGADARLGQMIVDGNGNIDVAWQDNSAGSYSVFFSRSTISASSCTECPKNGGVSFSRPVNLSNDPTVSSFNPNAQIAVDSSGAINVMWTDNGGPFTAPFAAVLFSRSVDGGTTFSAPVTVDSLTGAPSHPVQMVDTGIVTDSSGNIDLMWGRSRFNGDWFETDVRFAHSTDGGATFSAPEQLVGPSGGGGSAKMAVGSDGGINVSYYTNPFFPFGSSFGITDTVTRSIDGGATFPVPWSSNPCGNVDPAQLAVDAENRIDIVYVFRPGLNCSTPTGGILFVQSLDGASFSNPQSIASTGTLPVMAVDGSGGVYVVWQLFGNGHTDIFFSRSVALLPVTLSASDVTGGSPSTGTVTMNGPAPTGGAVISLSSSDPSVSVPATVTIPEGTTSAKFTVTTSPVALTTTVTISAVFSGVTQTASITVEPPALTSLGLNPSSTMGGSSSTGTVTLSGPAPAGGAVVALSNSNTSAASVPSSVTVPAGFSNAVFTVNTSRQLCPKSATITASFNAMSQTANLAVMPFVNLPPQACSAIGAHGPTTVGKP